MLGLTKRKTGSRLPRLGAPRTRKYAICLGLEKGRVEGEDDRCTVREARTMHCNVYQARKIVRFVGNRKEKFERDKTATLPMAREGRFALRRELCGYHRCMKQQGVCGGDNTPVEKTKGASANEDPRHLSVERRGTAITYREGR